MRSAIIAAAALGFLGLHGAAHADQIARYQSAVSIQHMSSPQRTQALAQSEGRRGETKYRLAQAEGPRGQTIYGRGVAEAETPNVSQQRRYATAEQTGVDTAGAV